jgi:hypothetical protein
MDDRRINFSLVGSNGISALNQIKEKADEKERSRRKV